MDCCDAAIYLPRETVEKLKWLLCAVLFINAGMFLLELISGLIADSSALIADSMDMFGDAFIYGLSLFVLSKNHQIQARASVVKGIIMLLFGFFVFWEVLQKMINPLVPAAWTISLVGLTALVANIVCYLLLTRHKDTSINLKSAWVCSRNDSFASASIIGAGVLVGYFNSMWPDIIVGLGIASLVFYFSARVIKESLIHL